MCDLFDGTAPTEAGARLQQHLRRIMGASVSFTVTIRYPWDDRVRRWLGQRVEHAAVGPDRSRLTIVFRVRRAADV